MTKLKSKKMNKSTFAVIIMAIVMVAMLAFGGTYAWFTSQKVTMSTDATTNMGRIILNEGSKKITATSLTANVLPSENLFKDGANTFSIKDDSNRASYIFFTISADIALATNGKTETDASKLTYADATPLTLTLTNLKVGSENAQAVPGETGVYYILTEEGSTVGTEFTVSGFQASFDGETTGNDHQQAKITVVVECASVQAKGFESKPEDAYAKSALKAA